MVRVAPSLNASLCDPPSAAVESVAKSQSPIIKAYSKNRDLSESTEPCKIQESTKALVLSSKR